MTTLTDTPPAPPALAGLTLSLDREVRFGDHQYAFHLRSGQDAWAELAARLADLNADHIFVITDTGVPAVTVRATLTAAGRASPVTPLTVPATEQAKNAGTVVELAERVIAAGATRSSVVIGLGGGLAGNVAGTVAGWVYRGAPRLVQIPTTLLALSDSVLSLKQAINSPCGKNHLGCYKAPVFVWGHLDILRTLPAAEKRAALCEAAKNVLAICPERYGEFAGLLRLEADYSDAELAWIVDLCRTAKQSVMAQDPYEAGDALVLEYGHTAGHAAEHLTAHLAEGRWPTGWPSPSGCSSRPGSAPAWATSARPTSGPTTGCWSATERRCGSRPAWRPTRCWAPCARTTSGAITHPSRAGSTWSCSTPSGGRTPRAAAS